MERLGLPAQLFAQLFGAAGCSIAYTFFLRGVAQATAQAASKIPTWRVEHSQQPFSWKSLGVDIRGRSRTLRINYCVFHAMADTIPR